MSGLLPKRSVQRLQELRASLTPWTRELRLRASVARDVNEDLAARLFSAANRLEEAQEDLNWAVLIGSAEVRRDGEGNNT